VDYLELRCASDTHTDDGLDPLSIRLGDHPSISPAPPLQMLVNLGPERTRQSPKHRLDLETFVRVSAEIVHFLRCRPGPT
jgi:hypothetical protein